MPAPSPVFSSQPHAAVGHADEHFERLRDVPAGRRSGEFPTKPTPHASRSFPGSKRPCVCHAGVGGTGAAAGSAVAFWARRGRARAR